MEDEITNHYIISLSLEEAAAGCQKTINIKTSSKCLECQGAGILLPPGSRVCPKCQGTGLIIHSESTRIDIEPGVVEGQTLYSRTKKSTGKAKEINRDIIVTISIKTHKLFKRKNDDIIYELPLNFAQCALGTEVMVPTLTGEAKLKIPPGTQTGDLFLLKGQGIPHYNKRGKGDQLIKIRVITPTSLNAQQRQLLDQLAETLQEVKPSGKKASKKGGHTQD